MPDIGIEELANKFEELSYKYYCEGNFWELMAREVAAMVLEARIEENKENLLCEKYHNKINTDRNIWESHVWAKDRIKELENELTALRGEDK